MYIFEAKHEYCEALSVCVQRLQIWVRHNSPSGSDELDLQVQFVSIFTRLKYFRMVHSEPMVLFVSLAESFCLCIFCLLLLLEIVVVDMLLAAPSSYLK